MPSSALVSVIIPSYNHENYVQETINSIIEQTYQNIELIVLDDGSKDNTWLKIQEMKELCDKRFVRVHFETKENEGTCKTINRMLSLAQGEFVYLIASDDLAKPHAIEKEADFLSSNPEYSLVVGNNEFIDMQSKRCYWDRKRNTVYCPYKAKFKTFADFLKKTTKVDFASDEFGSYEKLYYANHIPNGYLIRKSIFDIIGYFTPEAPLEDYWLMQQISKYSKMKYIDEILFSYRWHDLNTIKNSDKMRNIAKKTREYEIKLLENLDFSKVLDGVEKTFLEGSIQKRQGISYIFEIRTVVKQWAKYRQFYLFNKLIKERKVRDI